MRSKCGFPALRVTFYLLAPTSFAFGRSSCSHFACKRAVHGYVGCHFSSCGAWVSCLPSHLLRPLSLRSSKLLCLFIVFFRLERCKITVCGHVGGAVFALPRRVFGLPTCLLTSSSQWFWEKRLLGRAFCWYEHRGNSRAHRRIRHKT